MIITLPVAALACHAFVYAQQYQDHQHNAHSVKIDRKQSPSTISVHLFFDLLLLFFISKNKSHGPEHFRPSQHAPTQPTRTESNKPNTSKTSIPIVLPLDINHPPRKHQTSDLPLFQVHNKLTHSLVSLPPPPSHTHKTFYNPIYLHSFLLPAFQVTKPFQNSINNGQRHFHRYRRSRPHLQHQQKFLQASWLYPSGWTPLHVFMHSAGWTSLHVIMLSSIQLNHFHYSSTSFFEV